jgi:hypothetical protein
MLSKKQLEEKIKELEGALERIRGYNGSYLDVTALAKIYNLQRVTCYMRWKRGQVPETEAVLNVGPIWRKEVVIKYLEGEKKHYENRAARTS